MSRGRGTVSWVPWGQGHSNACHSGGWEEGGHWGPRERPLDSHFWTLAPELCCQAPPTHDTPKSTHPPHLHGSRALG